jgi:hypothetical protein
VKSSASDNVPFTPVGGGEKVCHFGGENGAGGVVTAWLVVGAETAGSGRLVF